MKLYNERECHWKMVFEENDGGVENKKVLLHYNMWDIYKNEN